MATRLSCSMAWRPNQQAANSVGARQGNHGACPAAKGRLTKMYMITMIKCSGPNCGPVIGPVDGITREFLVQVQRRALAHPSSGGDAPTLG
jgi:hypothetical protein